MLRQITTGAFLLAALTSASQSLWAQEENDLPRRRPGAESAPALPAIDPNAVPPPTRADVRRT